jgi:transposase
MKITLIGIDLAKTIFQVCGVNQAGHAGFNRQVRRHQLMKLLLQYPQAIIAMEACSGSNYWGRELQQRGFKVMLIPPQYVKPFVKGNKNDRNDAFAITEAARRPNIRTLIPRTLAQTDMIQVHRVRERLVRQRTAIINQLRGLLSEYGLVVGQGKDKLWDLLPALLSDCDNGLTHSARGLFQGIADEWRQLNERIQHCDQRIKQQSQDNESSQRLMAVKGVGVMTATAVVAHAGNGQAYKNGRQFAASLGLVPKEHSSGGIQKLGGLTKRGNAYLRHLLMQCAWSLLRYAHRSSDQLSCWAQQVATRRGKYKAVVAVANKLARILWAMLYHQSHYKPA